MPARRQIARAVLAAIALALAGAGCGGSESPGGATSTQPARPPISIGTKDFTEQYILGELYAQALEAKGFDVELITDIGNSEITHRALTGAAEAIDMYPEYVGVLLSEIAKVVQRPRSADAAYRLAKRFEERNGYTLLERTPFSDANGLAVKPAFARRHGVRTIADLGRVPGRLGIGAPSEFSTRFEGLIGLRRLYGLRRLRHVVLQSGEDRYEAFESGSISVVAIFTTDGLLVDRRYVLLDDPRGVFGDGRVAPIIRRSVLAEQGPGLAPAINAVSRLLTTAAMQRMNAAVDVRGRAPAAVAREFLQREGLL